ncbi:ATPase [Erythrobacter longus]|uniref:tRNA threonylcarbamoyladenosine biosynthesis protein TsaE n=1 Tax=Erythrobacter longus TaxID=1044 RepID=A0A074MEN7_ERYLO|nr:tRNA (adenosine(37)-N6)-threonylcarbamoyltransferase complex ATPase subunit type 1 TsaE [Erythrobacter longus]KEO91215.1 ATPase [Erythrobacter longus]
MSAPYTKVLPDLEATAEWGAKIADALRPGDVVELKGGLGAGKTTLARAILGALGHAGEVPSPTFTIIETYDAPPLRVPVAHADFYRLEDPSEALELGLDDYREDAVLLAEWPDHAGGFAHEAGCLTIVLESAGESMGEGRVATVKPGRDWLERLP